MGGRAVKGSGVSTGGKRGGRVNGLVGSSRRRAFESPIDKAAGYEVVWPEVAPLFNSARRLVNASFVYFTGECEDQGPLKIGVAKDPIARLRFMQTGNPRRLRVERILVGLRDTEQLLHELWEPFAIPSARNRVRVDSKPGTEWFRPEIRESLFPIVEAAASKQIVLLTSAIDDVDSGELETVIRNAHWAAGFIAKVRDQPRILARGAGYMPRPESRI